MESLQRLADDLGLTVIEEHGEHLGGYRPDDRVVRLRPGLPVRAARSVLAHEIAHHVLNHNPTPFGPLRKRQERAANEWAARLLIDLDDYKTAELIRDGHVPSMAFDLEVVPELVTAFQSLIERARLAVAA